MSERGSRSVLLLRSEELEPAIDLREVVEAVESAYRGTATGETVELPRSQLRHPATPTFLNVMPAITVEQDAAAVHVYSAGHKGEPGVRKITLAFSAADGRLEAIVESDWLSWARTGATGAVASRALARPGSRTLGIIGTGRQAAAQLLAHAASLPIERCLVHGRDPERRASFASEMAARSGLDVEPVDDADGVAAVCDIVCTATTSREPVFAAESVQPGLHVNAIGAHHPDRRELDTATLRMARVFADDPVRAVAEDGELALAARESGHEVAIVAGLADVVAGRSPGRGSASEVTVFLSGGRSAEYATVTAHVVARARALGLGQAVEL